MCGKALADTLSLVCNKVFATPAPQSKREDRLNSLYRDDLMWYPNYIHTNRFNGFKLNRNSDNINNLDLNAGKPETPMNNEFVLRRKKRGVVDECCKNPCTLKTLKSYCSTSTSIE
ncbi:hypothetical protein B4U80_13668 [Leptotrombidium deliense]|uniref:Insulin-like domain-containing protein n=1 Tax=Leptotrombidium deliense TaxID=299467 RepID=A0A443SN10_9ACAR|nr:hypothetical protein B4U80_13668 [Leptotrombidium deliense]